jgi:hypothetical protein
VDKATKTLENTFKKTKLTLEGRISCHNISLAVKGLEDIVVMSAVFYLYISSDVISFLFSR